MIKALEIAIDRLKELPPERQEEAAQVLTEYLEWNPEDYQLSDEQLTEVDETIRKMDAGAFATDADWKRLHAKMDELRKRKT
jgi:hypothetical protein